ncbi:MAG: hypothetical protein J0I34_25920 [Pseudonocardia sp.]|uniref:hypothetical protein n=1 Tax=unclassified Pseudonocardia TaxID=2619320 RepID=UPI00086EEECB|nr:MULTISPECIES: hypothetical protein [unclassified Pseudonocardia]MBN9112211.1 hypothetical protein [Pseudonocardia sp.]ODU30147.1 MAG: hypothetical protein ABS80_00655 [Pseudonocardia sp. SCN 72-51]ODV03071.1 MAG: hypothetical protein ABT15_23880 [Pseudonocardia sp. SCN 73-27]
MAHFDTINRGRTTTDPVRDRWADEVAICRLDAALGLSDPASGTRLLPLHHWSFLAPPCPTGARVRMRFVRPVPFDEPIAVRVRPDEVGPDRVHEVRVGTTIATSTTLLDGTARTSEMRIGLNAQRLTGPDIDLATVVDVVSATPVDVANRAAMVLLLAAAHGAGRRPLLGVHVDFHAPVTDVHDLFLDLAVTTDGRGLFAFGRASEPALVTGTLWFGCGVAR